MMDPMRKFEHAIKSRAMICKVLDQCQIITVSVNDGETPYTVPLCFGYKADDEGIKIIVHTGMDGKIVRIFENSPKVWLTAFILYHDLVKLYRQDYHDYRSFMAKGTVSRIKPGDPLHNRMPHGAAVQAMLKQYKRASTHFDVPHYMFMKVWCIDCKWEDISAKAESPIDRIEDVPFPGPDDPIDNRPPEYERIFCQKYFEFPPAAKAAEAECEAPEIDGPVKIEADDILVETAWDDKGEHVDADSYPFFLNEEGKMPRRYDLVFYNQPTTFRTDAVKFLEDDITAELNRERYEVNLPKFGENYSAMALVAGIYNAENLGLDLSSIAGLRVTVKDKATGKALLRYRVKADGAGKQSMQIARIVKDADGWTFIPEEKGYDTWSLPTVFAEYGLSPWRE
ncbi:MAG: TerD family protein [Firmicutes bacterium]|nr:TerD family protein [Bacillota bacterium]